jgi:GrpB-like predicted nucleotidyltransferase (UPF0157 family)
LADANRQAAQQYLDLKKAMHDAVDREIDDYVRRLEVAVQHQLDLQRRVVEQNSSMLKSGG